jgi:hypothetical protein
MMSYIYRSKVWFTKKFIVANTVTCTDVGRDRVELDASASYGSLNALNALLPMEGWDITAAIIDPLDSPDPSGRISVSDIRGLTNCNIYAILAIDEVSNSAELAFTPGKDPEMRYLSRCFYVRPSAQSPRFPRRRSSSR